MIFEYASGADILGKQNQCWRQSTGFHLPDTELKLRRLKDFFGKNVVLAFYVGAFTSVCQKGMCTFRDSMAKLNQLKAQVIGISVNDPFSNKAFAEKNMLGFLY